MSTERKLVLVFVALLGLVLIKKGLGSNYAEIGALLAGAG